jgi:hypothetical protein
MAPAPTVFFLQPEFQEARLQLLDFVTALLQKREEAVRASEMQRSSVGRPDLIAVSPSRSSPARDNVCLRSDLRS